MSTTRIQVALVIALALFAALLFGCADSRPERSRTAQAEEFSTPHTPTPIAPHLLVVATPTGVSPTTLPTPIAARIESSPTAPSVVPTPTSIPTPTAPASQSSAAPGWTIPINDHFGQSLLKERINQSDVIARVRLQSVEPAVAVYTYPSGNQWYHAAIKYTFEALEYLRGNGGSELIAVAPAAYIESRSEQDVLAAGPHIVAARDTQWDDREAIIFLVDHEKLTSHQYEIVTMIEPGAYTIDSPYNKTWLPEDIAGTGVGSTGETRFLLDSPVLGALGGASATHQAPTITLNDLRSQVASENELLRAGAATHGLKTYRECLYHKYKYERIVQSGVEYGDERIVRSSGGFKHQDIGPVDSGLPAGTRIGDPALWGSGGEDVSGHRIEGNDARLFAIRPLLFHIARPLPHGEYWFYWNFWGDPVRVPCGADEIPEEIRKSDIVFVNVTAPDSVLREAFFDPVDLGGSTVGAGGQAGVLSPASFTYEGVGDITISRIAWESPGRVSMELTPHGRLAGHHMDFIALDGAITLRLDFDDAESVSEEGGARALRWNMCSQPWWAGDLLMLRISASGLDLSGATNHPPCDSIPTGPPPDDL